MIDGFTHVPPEWADDEGLNTVPILENRRARVLGRQAGGRHRGSAAARPTHPNERPTSRRSAEQVLDDASRRWAAEMARWRRSWFDRGR